MQKHRKRFCVISFPLFHTFVAVEEKLISLLGQVRDIFMRYGLKSVTMDDLCREMSISKKTLYQYVSDKNELVKKTMEFEIEQDQCEIKSIVQKNLSAMDELFEITESVEEKIKNLHPSILYDMQKYYPEAWELMSNHRNSFIIKTIGDNIRKGQEEGIYRTDIDVNIISLLFATKVELLADNQLFARLGIKPSQIYFENLKYHVRGISNEAGRRALEKKLESKNPTL